ncbi:Oxalate:formate antiporter [Echinococcus granulosus]|uniref:Oxalate:formate antiporter n=1 Tax=Echinococcus granulosus TaxID=6210 RepID=A0A068WKH9_ECHGR|nr:Oxalate:formate antiporter [Echinococcus granulosus]CDS18119.1 oxalate:formate antiporter [Echinococcus granulosus]
MRFSIWGVLCVLGGFLYHLALGYFYTVGNMIPYVVSYMGIKSGEAAWFSSTLLALQAIFMPTGAMLATKVGYRPVLIIAMVFSAGGILLTRLTIDHGLGSYITTYCILNGIGMGLPYSVIFSVASSWFPEHRATVVGIISSGFGLGALVFTPIQTAIINPNNLPVNGTKFPPSVEEGIPTAFIVLGSIVLALELVGTILLRQKPEKRTSPVKASTKDVDETAISLTSGTANAEVKKEVRKAPRSHTVSEAVRSVDFYLLWLIAFCDIIPVVLLTSTFKVYGIRSAFDDQFLSAIATTSAAFNCLGRVFWGHMVDRFSSKCPLMCFLVMWGSLFVTFPYVAAGAAGRALYAIWVFGLFFSLSAHFVVIPSTCTRVFGPANMATIYGLIYFASCPSSLITAGVISQFDILGKWIAVYTACACACLLSFTMALFIRDKDAHCVGFTNQLCASLCDPCRKKIYNASEEELGEGRGGGGETGGDNA